jgi:hypothetical protein
MSENTEVSEAGSGMATGNDAGAPGERADPVIDPGDEVASAVADDAPLASQTPQTSSDDGLSPEFREPDPS